MVFSWVGVLKPSLSAWNNLLRKDGRSSYMQASIERNCSIWSSGKMHLLVRPSTLDAATIAAFVEESLCQPLESVKPRIGRLQLLHAFPTKGEHSNLPRHILRPPLCSPGSDLSSGFAPGAGCFSFVPSPIIIDMSFG